MHGTRTVGHLLLVLARAPGPWSRRNGSWLEHSVNSQLSHLISQNITHVRIPLNSLSSPPRLSEKSRRSAPARASAPSRLPQYCSVHSQPSARIMKEG